MLVEFERRICELARLISETTDGIAIKIRMLREYNSMLEEVQRLRDFYQDEMVGKGRILPEANKDLT